MFQNNLLMGAASISAGGITVDNSVRYNDDDSPRLYRTPSNAGNRRTGSLSLWYKRCNLGSIMQLFNSGAGDDITFNASDQLTFTDSSGVSYITTQVFRDPSAWGHLLFAWNTTLATAGDRLRIYHNGVEITAFATETNPDQNDEFEISNTVRQTIGANESNTEEFDGYLSQIYFVDSLQLTPSDFGEFDTNNVWRPIEYSVTSTGSDVTFTATGSAVDGVARSTYTYSSVAIGTVTSNRKVVIVITTDGSDTVTAMTVGGESANFLSRSNNGSRYAEIWQIDDPDSTLGTSEDIITTMSGTAAGQGMCTFDVKGADSYVYDSFTSTADPLAGTVSVPAGGMVIMVMGVGIAADPSEGFTFTSGLTERFNYKTEASEYGAAGADAFASATDQTISIDIDGTAVGANGTCISLSPIGGIGRNGFFLDFADANNFGLDAAGAAISSTTYRYLKCDVTDVESTAYLGIGEMEYYVGTTLYPTQTMTSNTAPSPLVASANSENSAAASAWAAFDDTDSTSGGSNWLTVNGVVTGYLKIDLGDGNGIAPTRIGITAPGTQNRAPWDFTIQGSNDDSDYTVLATYASNTTWLDDETRNWPVSNGNNFADAGLAVADQMSDTPTTNFCTLNPLVAVNATLSDGNLSVTTWAGSYEEVVGGTQFPTSGKWYWEGEAAGTVADYPRIGIIPDVELWSLNTANNAMGYNILRSIGWLATGDVRECTALPNTYTTLATYSTYTNGDVLGIALDLDNGELYLSKNGTFENSSDPAARTNPVKTGLLSYGWGPGVGGYQTRRFINMDFGQSGFTATPPTGFKALSTANFGTPTILDGTANFQTTLYTGDGSVRNIDQTGNSTFQPDWVWIKNRSAADNHMLIDIARGVTKEINSDDAALQTTDANGLTSFDSDGFGLGTGAGGYNDNTESFVAWQWLAGGGAGSSNEDGTINTTTTTVNTTAGFSISTYTGNGTDPATIGHGLGSKPKLIMGKSLSDEANHWRVGFDELGWTKAMYLSTTAAPYTLEQYWNNTDPTSTVWTTTDHNGLNGNTFTYVVYCFIDVEGFSKFGLYTGNGLADGTYIYTGFKPAYVMIKKTSGTGSWVIYDSQRSPYNEIDDQLEADTVTAETTGSEEIDFLSNGFKIRTADSDVNTSAGTYVYASFAEYPFGGEDITPATTF